MSKKEKRSESTTDFFLNVVNKEKKTDDSSTNEKKQVHHDQKLAQSVTGVILRVVNWFNTLLDKMLQSKFSIKILSLLLAMILLFSVTGGSFSSLFASPNTGDYLKNVPVEVEGLESDYSISGLPDSVNVGVIGNSVDISSLKLSKSYSVYVDCSGLNEGEHTVELKAKDFPDDLEVLIKPQTVTIKLTQKVTKTFELGYKFIHQSKMDSKYSVAVNNINHKKVEVSGAQESIDKVYQVVALVDLDGVTNSFQQSSKIVAYDRSGKKLNVDIIPKRATVDCTVSSYSKSVPLLADYKNSCIEGYGVKSIEFSEEKVKIYGDKSDLDKITSIPVSVDLSNLSSSVSLKGLKLVKPDSVNKLEYETVDAQLEIAQANTTKVFNSLDIEATNTYSGYSGTVSSKAQVTITGVGEVVNSLTNDDIKCYIDCDESKATSRSFEVHVTTPTNNSLSIVINSSASVTVRIRKK
ncbi:MAG: CdaR family protein [Thomasclavelia sp.]|nr:CdaR family protein [Thomasclavelia sp.]